MKNKLIAELEREISEAIELLKTAKCPTCDGTCFMTTETGGCGPDGENDTREVMFHACPWCAGCNAFLNRHGEF